MTVSSSTNKATYVGNGALTVFSYTYRMDNDDDMEVYLNEVIQPSGYTVNLNSDHIGGDVTFDVAPAQDVVITLLRSLEMTQETDYVPYDAFPAEAHEDALDKLTMLVQGNTEEISRCVQAPIGEDTDIDYKLPTYDAGKAITWSESGDKELVNSDFPLQTYVDVSGANADSAQQSAIAAAGSADYASSKAGEAEIAKDFANEWATNPVDDPVDDLVNPEGYSAYHWAQKSLEGSEILSDIDTIINPNAVVDVFIYDTTKDDDGGAWVDKATSQGWYHEALNTGTRGSTRPFPKLALIVLELGALYIYDGNDPLCPMWMIFNNTGYGEGHLQIGVGATCVTAKNGKICVGSVQDSMHDIRFIEDITWYYTPSPAWGGSSVTSISERNTSDDYFTGAGVGLPVIIEREINDLAIASDGNMNNIIYVATNSGVTRIAPDQSVSNWTGLGGGFIVSNVGIIGDSVFWSANVNTVQNRSLWQYTNVPLVDTNINSADILDSSFSASWANYIIPINNSEFDYPSITGFGGNAVSTTYGLTILYPRYDEWGQSMIAQITKDFNSGIMHGDIKGAWLADTDSTNLVGSELVTNGTFDTDTTGWTAYNSGVLSVVTNALRITNGAAAFGSAVQSFATIVGEKYTLSFDTVNATPAKLLSVRISTNDTIGGNGDIIDGHAVLAQNTTYTYTFIAITTTTYIRLFGSGVDTDYFEFDNVSVRLVDADRSYKNKGLAVYGTVNKNLIASGAELVGYNGWSAADYLEQAPNTDLDFSTDDFYVMGWVQGNASSYKTFLQRGEDPEVVARQFHLDSGDTNSWRFLVGGGATTSTIKIQDGVWTFICAVRRSGTGYCYTNGVQGGEANVGGDISSLTGNAVLRIGERVIPIGSFQTNPMSLIRIGGGAPTDEQIKQIYETERPLFNENARCTLQGSSSDVKALAHSEQDDILTVCSTDHLTRFNGLIVESDEATIATAVSRACGNKELTND